MNIHNIWLKLQVTSLNPLAEANGNELILRMAIGFTINGHVHRF